MWSPFLAAITAGSTRVYQCFAGAPDHGVFVAVDVDPSRLLSVSVFVCDVCDCFVHWIATEGVYEWCYFCLFDVGVWIVVGISVS